MHKRPLSPHLQIYKMPLTAGLMSITHRMTGVFLVLGTLLLSYWLMAVAAGADSYLHAQQLLMSIPGLILLFLWTVALFYHFCNGIRHLFWDMGAGFTIKQSKLSGYVVLLMTFLLTGITWGIAFLGT